MELKQFLLRLAFLGTSLFFLSCVHETDPTGPTCNNLAQSGPACADCDASNAAHLACYSVLSCDNMTATGPACGDCDPNNPAHLACPEAIPDTVQVIFNQKCTYCHYYTKADPAFPNDPLSGGEGWSNTGGSESDMNIINNALALSIWDPVTFAPIPEETPLISYARLVGAPTFQLPGAAPTLRVDPGNLDNSYLYEKINSDTPKEGERMAPFNSLGAKEICIIRTWIQAGAKVAGLDTQTDYSVCDGL